MAEKENKNDDNSESAIFFCFSIDKSIENGTFEFEDGFDYKIHKFNELTVLKVFLKDNIPKWRIINNSLHLFF